MTRKRTSPFPLPPPGATTAAAHYAIKAEAQRQSLATAEIHRRARAFPVMIAALELADQLAKTVCPSVDWTQHTTDPVALEILRSIPDEIARALTIAKGA